MQTAGTNLACRPWRLLRYRRGRGTSALPLSCRTLLAALSLLADLIPPGHRTVHHASTGNRPCSASIATRLPLYARTSRCWLPAGSFHGLRPLGQASGSFPLGRLYSPSRTCVARSQQMGVWKLGSRIDARLHFEFAARRVLHTKIPGIRPPLHTPSQYRTPQLLTPIPNPFIFNLFSPWPPSCSFS
jgi:hypothetical protein